MRKMPYSELNRAVLCGKVFSLSFLRSWEKMFMYNLLLFALQVSAHEPSSIGDLHQLHNFPAICLKKAQDFSTCFTPQLNLLNVSDKRNTIGQLHLLTSYAESCDMTSIISNSTNFKYNDVLHLHGAENNGKLLLLINIITY